MQRFAFRCRTCRHLVEAGAAGERTLPAACPACGAGVSFDPATGAKRYHDDNWIVLGDLSGDELEEVLAFHGIKPSQIERHKPFAAPEATRAPQSIDRTAEEGLGREDVAG
jgi:hypothetical protein